MKVEAKQKEWQSVYESRYEEITEEIKALKVALAEVQKLYDVRI